MKKKNFKYDVLLLGHAVSDFIIDEKKIKIQLGGIYNLYRIFKKYKFNVKAETCKFGHAFIKIDRKNCKKIVKAKINEIAISPKIHDCRWMHIAYANELDEEYIPIHKDTIYSVDLCKGNKANFSRDPNYIFLSIDEHRAEDFKKNKNSTIIGHSEKEVFIFKQNKMLFRKNIDKLQNINVLGAGDALASYFIVSKLNGQTDIDSLIFSLKNVKKFLLNN
jgi:hypothetical protein